MILIADSGSTKTDWCLLASSGKTTRVQTEGMNPYQQTREQLRWVVGECLLPQIAKDLWAGPITDVWFYGAGCTPQKAPVVKEVLSSFFRRADVVVESDMVGAAYALLGKKEGIACILGTGSNSCYWDGEKIVQNVPALGYVLGDEGSGAVLGKRLVADLLKNQLGEDLKEKFLNRFQTTQADIIEHVYRQPLANRYLASLSVFAAENIGNEKIVALVSDHFRNFVDRNLKQYPSGLSVGYVGSIAYFYKDILLDVMNKAGYDDVVIMRSPMDGLVALAKDVCTDSNKV